jgi:hypothetical protein
MKFSLSILYLLLSLLQHRTSASGTNYDVDAGADADARTRTTSIYQETSPQNQNPPTACQRIRRLVPAYSLQKDNGTYNLVVDVQQIAPKHLNVHVDYEKGWIEVLGWIFDHDDDDEKTTPISCIYQEWSIRTAEDILHEQDDDSNTEISIIIQDLTMQRQDGNLVISIPFQQEQPQAPSSPSSSFETTKAPSQDSYESTTPSSSSSYLRRSLLRRSLSLLRVATDGNKKLRGLARINNTTIPSDFDPATAPATTVHHFNHQANNATHKISPQQQPPSSNTSKSKQRQALERFLAISLTNTDEESYWLHKM